jgi:hypothetical protein
VVAGTAINLQRKSNILQNGATAQYDGMQQPKFPCGPSSNWTATKAVVGHQASKKEAAASKCLICFTP